MGKKLLSIWLLLTLIACSSTSISFASNLGLESVQESNATNDVENEKESTNIELSEDENIEVKDEAIKAEEAKKAEAAEKKKAEEEKRAEAVEKKKAAEIKERNGLAAYIRSVNRNVSVTKSRNMADAFMEAGEKYRVDEKILMAIAKGESTFYTNAKSPWGYKGLMQTNDRIARNYGYKATSAYRADVSIKIGARYLRAQIDYFDSLYKGISSYCYGSGSVKSGNYSKAFLNKILKDRATIRKYLERHNYV